MEEYSNNNRRRGSLVIPILLILLGVLLLLDNLNIIPSIDWATIWKFWPLVLIAIGLEIILGRRVSCGGLVLLGIVVIIGGAMLGWSMIGDAGDRTRETITFPLDGIERTQLELEMGTGEFQVAGYADMSDLMVADLELASGVKVDSGTESRGDAATAWLISDRDFFVWPQIFDGKGNRWDVHLNDRVRWELDAKMGVGELKLDLSGLRVSDLAVGWGVGSVDVVLPKRSITQVNIDGGIGDLTIDVPAGTPARFRVDRGISDLTVGSRFKRHGDYYETEGFSRDESYIEMEIDMGVGSVTVR